MCFPAEHGQVTRGIPTSTQPSPLRTKLRFPMTFSRVALAEVDMRGIALEPLYKTVPRAALGDSQLYQLLALGESSVLCIIPMLFQP